MKFASVCAGLIAAFVVALPPTPAAAVDFAAPTYTGLYGSPFALATTELNGDGHPDLVAGLSSEVGAKVTVLLGDGRGAFGHERQYELNGSAVFGLTVADLDGAGRPDIAAALGGAAAGKEVAVMLGSGDTNFGAPSYFASAEGPVGIAAGRFAGGTLPDLVVANETAGDVSLLVNESTPGHASFAAPKQFAPGHGAFAPAVADFNGDGIPDVVVADSDETGDKSGYTILDGTGTASGFSAPKFTELGENLIGVATGDFNGDGYPDLAFVDLPGFSLPSKVYVLLNNKSGGFEAPVTYDAHGDPQSIAVGEVEGDGRPDLLVGEGAGNVLVLHNNGNGTFTEGGRFPAGSGVGPLLTSDLTGNGAEDILDADQNGTVATLLNIGHASPSPGSLAYGTVAQGQESAPQTVTVTNTGAAPMTIEGLALAGASPAAFDLDDAILGFGAGTCTGTTLAAGASCTATVAFRPTQTGALSATLLVFTNTGAAPASVALSGAGVTPVPPEVLSNLPVLSSLSETANRWREGNSPALISKGSKKKKLPVGTTFSFSLNVPASVTLTFTTPTSGRKVRGQCVAQTKKDKKGHHCTRTVVAGTLTFSAHAGENKVRFQGRVSKHKKLEPGRYTLVIMATNTAGQHSSPQSLRFTIVK